MTPTPAPCSGREEPPAPTDPASDARGDTLSRVATLDAALNRLGSPTLDGAADGLIHNWSLRPAHANDALLRESYRRVLAESAAAETADERLVMYDACDAHEVRAQCGGFGRFRKRLDARRGTKPKKPDAQTRVCTPFEPSGFHFGKIRNEGERLLRLQLCAGRYDVLTNRFPLFPAHLLLVADALVPQQMTEGHLASVVELLQQSSFCAYFNSWCASASINHFHCHLIDEAPPITEFPLVPGPTVAGYRCLQPQRFSGFCYVFPNAALWHVAAAVREMQAENQPHNLLFTPSHVYLYPKPLVRPSRTFELYPETVGGPELIGSFTVYREEDYRSLSAAAVDELVRINTAPLPSRLLQPTPLHAHAHAHAQHVQSVAPAAPISAPRGNAEAEAGADAQGEAPCEAGGAERRVNPEPGVENVEAPTSGVERAAMRRAYDDAAVFAEATATRAAKRVAVRASLTADCLPRRAAVASA